MKEWGGGGGWTVAFSSPDKSKKEGVVINVPKWPRVTGRPSPVTALKRGHLHDHPSRRQIQTHTLHTPCQCMRVCVCMYVWIKQRYPQLFGIQILIYTATCKYTISTCMAYFTDLNTVKVFNLYWMHKCAVSQFRELDTEHWVGGTEGSLTT